MNRFHLKILAAERMFFDGPCESLIVPTMDGLYGIQAEHQDVVIAALWKNVESPSTAQMRPFTPALRMPAAVPS